MSRDHARQNILATLRAGLAAAPLSPPEPPARPASLPIGPVGSVGSVESGAWELLAAKLAPLDVRVRLAKTPVEAAAHVADIARERQAATYTRWDLLPVGPELDSALAGLTRVAPDCCQALAQVDLGLTNAHAALVDSGSLVLVAGPGCARAVSLLPPVHVCLVERSVLQPDVSALPELLRRHADTKGLLPSCLNLVTGPSSTADIELVLVRGVHGPGALEIVALDWD